jgi:sulfur-oxidizing protein SoxX
MKIAVGAATLATALGCASFPDAEQTRGVAEQMVSEAYPGMPEALTVRNVQDADQKICSKVGGEKLSSDEAAQIVQSARASMRYPESGRLAGDWKVGEQLANNAAGMRVRDGQVEKVKENGALCINCHALDPKEVNAGNLGPSLVGYGVRNGNSDAAVKHAYEKIYNAWVYFPCSNMPRMGRNGYLTPQQIAHVVAYLVDPQSPVNRK